jgi:homoserine dehydrogenase
MSANEIPLLQLGVGGVGRVLAHQVLAQQQALEARYGFTLGYLALIDRSGVLHTGQMLPPDVVASALEAKQQGHGLGTLEHGRPLDDWRSLLPRTSCIIVDTTAADGMVSGLLTALAEGHRLVLANKRPLTGPFDTFKALTDAGNTRYEATVGAGLPVISTLQALLDSGDTLISIEASMSGTLGYMCSALEQGIPFSKALRTARDNGWTEPDPRDDLSGDDVARKALILARTCGLPWEIDNVPNEPWFPPEMVDLAIETFMERAPELDRNYAERVMEIQANDATLRYVASVEPDSLCVGLRQLNLGHPLAALRGPDNLFALTTERYAEHPLIIRGPGAGPAVTAAGVLGDIIATARQWKRTLEQ